jgi:hypothetical protein
VKEPGLALNYYQEMEKVEEYNQPELWLKVFFFHFPRPASTCPTFSALPSKFGNNGYKPLSTLLPFRSLIPFQIWK